MYACSSPSGTEELYSADIPVNCLDALDTSNVSCRVVSRRDVTSQVEFGLNAVSPCRHALYETIARSRLFSVDKKVSHARYPIAATAPVAKVQ